MPLPHWAFCLLLLRQTLPSVTVYTVTSLVLVQRVVGQWGSGVILPSFECAFFAYTRQILCSRPLLSYPVDHSS